MKRFRDRADAGRVLADKLRRYAGTDAIVLALPRGGVPVGFEVARDLALPLDVFVVRKLGVPAHEELGMVTEKEARELERREREYRPDGKPLEVEERTAILVDDGLATGSTMLAAVQALRKRGPHEIVVAVPAAPRDTCRVLAQYADEIVCAMTPEQFFAVGACYDDFSQTSDEEVRRLLVEARRAA